jgi:hypothetical protein
MRIIAFIKHSADIHRILNHIGVESQPPHIAPALREDWDAKAGEGGRSRTRLGLGRTTSAHAAAALWKAFVEPNH